MLSRIVVALSAVAASVGLLLYGMGTAYQPRDETLEQWGLILLAAGVIALLIGIVWYRKVEAAEVTRIETEIRRRSG